MVPLVSAVGSPGSGSPLWAINWRRTSAAVSRDTPLSQISNFDVERYKKNCVGEGAKVGIVNRELAALSHLFNKGIEWAWIDKRPAKIKRYSEERGRITYLTVEQIKRLLEAAQ